MEIRQKAKELAAEMTQKEKISLLSGRSMYEIEGCERLDLPAYPASDGPAGIKRVYVDEKGFHELGANTCFPAGSLTACSFNPENAYRIGKEIGYEAQSIGTGISLGPGVNIKRTPLCGRNFEYYSEDPYLSGKMGTAHVKGVQSEGTASCVKHFAANNEEYKRNFMDSEVDERTLREIYLAAFEMIVKEAAPWSVMSAYNLLNGTGCSENRWLLTDVLRGEWGFEGAVMSDWDAVKSPAEAAAAGCDIRMPGSGKMTELYEKALADGTMTEEQLDIAAERIISLILWVKEHRKNVEVPAPERGLEAARECAADSMVLMKNEEELLPLAPGGKYAVIGGLAEDPMYQGGGSSVNHNKVLDIPLDFLKKQAEIRYAKGYDSITGEVDEKLVREAENAAAAADAAIVFLGEQYGTEAESYDRTCLKLPENQIQLLSEIIKVQKHVAVVLMTGSCVEMPWDDMAQAILYAGYAGEGVGSAVSDILFGKVNPSGHLSETWPVCLEQSPSFETYPGAADRTVYQEGVFVGYRWYDTKKIPVKYAFGHGLSYTKFRIHDLVMDRTQMKESDSLKVSVQVTNEGSREGQEVVQIYVHDCISSVPRPYKELRAFGKVSLLPGETKTLEFTLTKRAFAYYERRIHDWHAESGEYEVMAGDGSDRIAVSGKVFLQTESPIPHKYGVNTSLDETRADARVYKRAAEEMGKIKEMAFPGAINPLGPLGTNAERSRGGKYLSDLVKNGVMAEKELESFVEELNALQ